MLLSTTYDPDAPEGSKSPGGQYMSKKDFLPILGVVLLLGALSIPLYQTLAAESEKTLCKRNLAGISKAILQYAASYDDRLPPAYVVGENGSPAIFAGRPVTWATQVQGYLGSSSGFRCSAAPKAENTPVASGIAEQTEDIALSYGMYRTLSAVAVPTIQDAASAVMIAETANHGAGFTYDPIPFTDSHDHEVPFDGFLIGWDTSNFTPDSLTKSVSRLAFKFTENGRFSSEKVQGRHGNTIFCLRADGHLGRLLRQDAYVENTKDGIAGQWRVPKSYSAFDR